MTRCKVQSGPAIRNFATLILVSAAMMSLAGCGGAADQPAVMTVQVSIDQQPVESVRVAFAVKGDAGEQDASGAIVLEGISDHTGRAEMRLKDGVELSLAPTEYAVICESLGDWQVVKPWSDVAQTPLTVTWPGDSPLTIDLPTKAARPL